MAPVIRWWDKVRGLLPSVVWVCLILAIAGYGAVIVRNVTDVLAGIAHRGPVMAVVERPNR
jgi:hypothetical protein